MPISAQRRYMSKNEFQDALSLRYGMQIKGVALKCACGDTNTTIHANNCKLGGYVTRRHDAMRNFLQQKAAIVYNDTEIEPHLQETETHAMQQRANPQDKSRSDIRINGFNREFQNSQQQSESNLPTRSPRQFQQTYLFSYSEAKLHA